MGLAAGARGLVAVTSPRGSRRAALTALREQAGNDGREGENQILRATRAALQRYFIAGRNADFSRIPLDPDQGTPFQRRVWQELCRIPFGETRTYSQVAQAVGRPNAARAIGQCNARNPWAIIVPCHRVVGANAALTGYAGGLDIKKRLLEWEGISVTALNAMELAAAPQRRDIYAHRN